RNGLHWFVLAVVALSYLLLRRVTQSPFGMVLQSIRENELHGYHVLSARDLDEALAASLGHPGPLALVVADLLLPGVAGDGVLQRLGPTRASARVLYLSGDLEDSVEDYHGLRPGRGFLHKPFTVDALVQKVREIVGR